MKSTEESKTSTEKLSGEELQKAKFAARKNRIKPIAVGIRIGNDDVMSHVSSDKSSAKNTAILPTGAAIGNRRLTVRRRDRLLLARRMDEELDEITMPDGKLLNRISRLAFRITQ